MVSRCRPARWLGLALLSVAGACASSSIELPPPQFITEPDPAGVESVLFLIGDAGDAQKEYAPILTRLAQDVEAWTQRLGRDSAVVVIFLGDNVYPLGMHLPEADEFPRDSAVVADQVAIVNGPHARARGTRGYFVAGNHDWGLREEWEGYVRLKTMSDFLDRERQRTGAAVYLEPEPGTGGPFTFDLGRQVRIILLDTAWWILDGGKLGLDSRAAILGGIREAMQEAGERQVVIGTHHPFRSAGPHGGEVSFWRTLGVRYLLTRSGALLQDLTSIPFRDFEAGLRSIFSELDPPLIFAGGHEHSLQLFEAVDPTDPAFSIVSGSASKLSSLGSQAGMLFGASSPGYFRVLVGTDGRVSLFIEAAPEEFLECEGDPAELAICVEQGVAAFRTIYSRQLR